MRIRLSVPDEIIDGPIIDAALEATTRANEALAARGMLPDMGEALRNGVRWRPEPWLGERFDLAPDVVSRGWGDCDDWGPWLAAQLRAAGEEARAFARQTSPTRWHVEVERGDGQILDPSKWAGMPTSSRGKQLVSGGKAPRAIAGPGESSLCVIPWGGKWHVRADHPLTERLHVSGMARGADLEGALARAVGTYAAVAEGMYGIGDATVTFGLADIISATAPAGAAAMGQPCSLELRLGPFGQDLAQATLDNGEEAGVEGPKVNRIGGSPPQGWPAWARTYGISGPGGNGAARLVRTPGGGPLLVTF